MKERRYKEYYKTATELDARTGRPRQMAVYRGPMYRFPGGALSLRRRAIRPGVAVALYWAFTLCYLGLSRYTGRCAYALLPVLAGLFPGVYALLGLVSALRAPERMTVVQRENGPGRLVRACLGCGLFGAAGALGCAFFLTLNGLWREGWPEALFTAAASIAAWSAFARARQILTRLEETSESPLSTEGAE